MAKEGWRMWEELCFGWGALGGAGEEDEEGRAIHPLEVEGQGKLLAQEAKITAAWD